MTTAGVKRSSSSVGGSGNPKKAKRRDLQDAVKNVEASLERLAGLPTKHSVRQSPPGSGPNSPTGPKSKGAQGPTKFEIYDPVKHGNSLPGLPASPVRFGKLPTKRADPYVYNPELWEQMKWGDDVWVTSEKTAAMRTNSTKALEWEQNYAWQRYKAENALKGTMDDLDAWKQHAWDANYAKKDADYASATRPDKDEQSEGALRPKNTGYMDLAEPSLGLAEVDGYVRWGAATATSEIPEDIADETTGPNNNGSKQPSRRTRSGDRATPTPNAQQMLADRARRVWREEQSEVVEEQRERGGIRFTGIPDSATLKSQDGRAWRKAHGEARRNSQNSTTQNSTTQNSTIQDNSNVVVNSIFGRGIANVRRISSNTPVDSMTRPFFDRMDQQNQNKQAQTSQPKPEENKPDPTETAEGMQFFTGIPSDEGGNDYIPHDHWITKGFTYNPQTRMIRAPARDFERNRNNVLVYKGTQEPVATFDVYIQLPGSDEKWAWLPETGQVRRQNGQIVSRDVPRFRWDSEKPNHFLDQMTGTYVPHNARDFEDLDRLSRARYLSTHTNSSIPPAEPRVEDPNKIRDIYRGKFMLPNPMPKPAPNPAS